MAFIGKRTTRRGVVSTALVESCWQDGKLRHRLIANLHGAENLVAALGRLAAEREAVRKERAELELSIPHAEEFYQVITTAVRTVTFGVQTNGRKSTGCSEIASGCSSA
jgi:hypothetical protein